jgi:hypothetical protein
VELKMKDDEIEVQKQETMRINKVRNTWIGFCKDLGMTSFRFSS